MKKLLLLLLLIPVLSWADVNDCILSISESAKTNRALSIGAVGCRLKHNNNFFSTKRARGKCLINVAESAKTDLAVSMGAAACARKYKFKPKK